MPAREAIKKKIEQQMSCWLINTNHAYNWTVKKQSTVS